MDRSLLILLMVVLLLVPVFTSAETRKMTDLELKNTKARSGIKELIVPVAIQAAIPSEIVRGFDILDYDQSGVWLETGNTTFKNGVLAIDETIHTTGIRYDNIRLDGAFSDAASFGSIYIENAVVQVKGQVKVQFIP